MRNPKRLLYLLTIRATFLVEGLFYGVATWIVLAHISRQPVVTHVASPDEGEGFNWKIPVLGAIGGMILGLASPKSRIVACLLLCLTGVIWFGNAFAFGFTLPLGEPSFSWEGWAGTVGGAIFGLTLAPYYKINHKWKAINFPPVSLGQKHC
jgi:hypothetical protein